QDQRREQQAVDRQRGPADPQDLDRPQRGEQPAGDPFERRLNDRAVATVDAARRVGGPPKTIPEVAAGGAGGKG
ncbi:MAG: hypothetical protein R3349_10235, partial [Geminicoccaceae bacterium]|nr:hypothetical protein [Geminicoccaceae bacterium]